MTTRWVGLLAALGMLVGAAQVADAADLSPAAPVYAKAPVVAPVATWDGFYAGVNVGGAWGHSDSATTTVFDTIGYFSADSVPAVNAAGAQSFGMNGVTGGIQAGYNRQFGAFVAGIEADVEAMRLKGSASSSGVYPCCAPAMFTINANVSADWLATFRGRLGVANDGWLFYVTGGAAVSEVKAAWSFGDNCADVFFCGGGLPIPNASEAASVSTLKLGWVVGAGVEAKFAQRWSWKAEYLHVDLGSVSAAGVETPPNPFVGGSNPFSHNATLTVDIGRVGLNYQF
jgi:outer membrane immunogenic protein